MKAMYLMGAAVLVLADTSVALAQDGEDWTGGYVGGRVGYSSNVEDEDETILFDTNLDGAFGDTVRTSRGADAFSPGFCGGTAVAAVQTGCSDRGGTEWAVHAGYDTQFGRNIVIGIVADYGQADIRDGVTAFSSTPAFYSFERRVDDIASFRGRLGFALDRTLIYGTGGVVYAKVENRFTTSNGVNTFTSTDEDDDSYGYRAGGGIEHRFEGGLALGVQYLYTSIKEDDFSVRSGGANVPVSNPFILVNPNGTDFRRSDNRLDWHNISVTASFRF
jgi:outer membrane immunogenic protein